jgi:glycosyltransferase involved in cell wall biosynthesis
VGRLAEEKNVMGLLESWLDYRRGGGSWPLVLVGDGPEAKALKAAAAASQFGAEVLFPGLKSSRALLPFYAFAGCFVLPSTREPWGLVVNEAMASGLPVLVSTACGCGPDLVSDGLNGFLFKPTDKAALTGLLHRIASRNADELERMGRCSRQIIGNYSPEHFGRSVALIGRQPDAGNSLEASYGGNL